MSSSGIAVRQVGFEQKSFWRNPASAFFAFLFPIIFLVVFATLFKGQKVQIGTVSTTYDNYYIPALVAFGDESLILASLRLKAHVFGCEVRSIGRPSGCISMKAPSLDLPDARSYPVEKVAVV